MFCISFSLCRWYLKHLKAKYIGDMQQLDLEEAASTDETTPSSSEATPTNLDKLQLSPIIEELK